jgi:phage-related protein
MSNSDNTKCVKFANNSVEKAFQALPWDVQVSFAHNLDMVCQGRKPELDIDHLTSVDKGVIELKINGSPAYRCVYYNKLDEVVVVVAAFEKTTNGTATKQLPAIKKRVSLLKSA